jgi:hypothetical protein
VQPQQRYPVLQALNIMAGRRRKKLGPLGDKWGMGEEEGMGESTDEEVMDRKHPEWRQREVMAMEAADAARKAMKAMKAAGKEGAESNEGDEGDKGEVIIATSATLPGSSTSTQHHGKEGDEVDAFIAKRRRRYPMEEEKEKKKEKKKEKEKEKEKEKKKKKKSKMEQDRDAINATIRQMTTTTT